LLSLLYIKNNIVSSVGRAKLHTIESYELDSGLFKLLPSNG